MKMLCLTNIIQLRGTLTNDQCDISAQLLLFYSNNADRLKNIIKPQFKFLIQYAACQLINFLYDNNPFTWWLSPANVNMINNDKSMARW